MFQVHCCSLWASIFGCKVMTYLYCVQSFLQDCDLDLQQYSFVVLNLVQCPSSPLWSLCLSIWREVSLCLLLRCFVIRILCWNYRNSIRSAGGLVMLHVAALCSRASRGCRSGVPMWYRRWTTYSKPFYPVQPPSPPKFSVNVAWNALAPMDEQNQTPNITFSNTRAETLRFRGAGVQHSACCRVEYFVHLLSPSLTITSFGLQTLLWKHHSACCWSYAKLRKTLAFHKYMPPVRLPSHFFLFPNSQLNPKCTKHCVFTGKCNLCASRPIFFYSLTRNLFQTAKKHCFHR